MKPILFSCVMVSLLSACSKTMPDADRSGTSDKKAIVFLPEVGTRATMEDGFANDDIVGIFMSESDNADTSIWNYPCWFEEENNVWKGPYDIFWKDKDTKMNIVAYYPYSFIGENQDLESLNVAVPYEQSSIDSLRKADFLWARISDATPDKYPDGVPLDMSHLLSKLKVNMNLTVNGLPSRDEAFVQLLDVKNQGWVNLNNGEVTTDTEKSTYVNMCYDVDKRVAEAIVYPQTIEAGNLLQFILHSEDGHKAYGYKLKEPLVMEGGKEYVIDYNLETDPFIYMPYDSVYTYIYGIKIDNDYFNAYSNGVEVQPDETEPFVSNLDMTIGKSENSDWFDYKFENGRFHFGIQENLTSSPRKGYVYLRNKFVEKKITVYQGAVNCKEYIIDDITYEAYTYHDNNINNLNQYDDYLTFKIDYEDSENKNWADVLNTEPGSREIIKLQFDENPTTMPRSCVITFLYKDVLPVMVLRITQLGRTE